MVQRKIDRNQSELGIVTLDSNIPKDHISHCSGFIEEVYLTLNIEEPKKESTRVLTHIIYVKLLFYEKIEHIESLRYIADM